MQKASHRDNAPGGDGLHQLQSPKLESQAQPTSKSWGDILKSWAPTDGKSFLFTIWALVMLPVGIGHFAHTGDFKLLMIVFGVVSLYCGIRLKDLIALFLRVRTR